MTVQDLVLVLVVATAVAGAGAYAWYGFALSRLFPKLGIEGWKGWVPVLNEVEILVRGGVPGWSVVYFFIPVVQLYGIYLKAIALHRINESFGRGAGSTVLGVFLPPVWATLLAAGSIPAAGDYDRRVEGLLAAGAAAPPPAPLAPPVRQPTPPAPALAPAPAPALAVNAPPPPFVAPAPAPAPAPVPAPADDDLDSTVVVDRRPAVPWRLVTDEGDVIPLRTRTVLLGRKPVSTTEGVAAVAVPDATKTLSKNHARLHLSEEGAWTIVDLDSTNGVIIVEPDGTETLLPQGGSAPVPGRFILGKVGMRVRFDDIEAAP